MFICSNQRAFKQQQISIKSEDVDMEKYFTYSETYFDEGHLMIRAPLAIKEILRTIPLLVKKECKKNL